MHLRPYQSETKDIIIKNIKKGLKNQLITLPTGAGKTVIASALIKELIDVYNKKVFFVVAGSELVMQSYNKFSESFINTSIIKAGKDNYYKEWADCQVVMIQTFSRRTNKLPDLKPDIIIIDEVDYGYNGGMLKNLLEMYPKSKIIGLTATPITDKGYLLPKFDYYYNEITVRYLQKEGFLSLDKHNFRCAKPDLNNVRMKSTGDFNDDDLDEACNQAYLLEDIIRTYKQKDLGYKGICFAISIKHAENLQRAFNNAGISCGIIHSKMKKGHRDYWMDEHKKGNIRMLVNVGVLTRGYDDINIIDLLCCRPTASERLYKQIIGRAARLDKNGLNFFRHFDYADNIERFGLWSDECLYSLDDKPKREHEFESIVCPNCFDTIFDKSTICPFCGYTLTKQQEQREREIIEKKRVQELIEYQNTSPIYELEKIIDSANGYYYNRLRPLKPSGISIELFDTEVKKIIKYCIKMGYKVGYIYFKVRDKFKGM